MVSTDDHPATEDLGDRFRLGAWRFDTPIVDVYDGRDLRLDRPVQVPLLKPVVKRSPDAVARFLAAARRAAAVVDPHLVAVYDSGEIGGRTCIVTEAPARRLSEARRAMSPDELARVGADFEAGLRAAHAAGLVHGAIDDTALLVDDDGTGKLADTGIYPAFAGVVPRSPLAQTEPPSVEGDRRALAAQLAVPVAATHTTATATATMEAPVPASPLATRRRLPARSAIAWLVAAAAIAGLVVVSLHDDDPPTPGRAEHAAHHTDLPPEIPGR
ncbi:MAG TPA: hypothetical protein VHD87_10745 [Acidimicrobiales bacterium]|nr:hypothetical protein [Acidimicrobiales bacterium]